MSFVLRLPEEQRHRFTTVLGNLIPDDEITAGNIKAHTPDNAIVVAVGDVTSATLLRNGILPDILLVDFATKRGECHDFTAELERYSRANENTFSLERMSVVNPKERISSELWDAIRTCYRELAQARTEGTWPRQGNQTERDQGPGSSNKKIYKNSQQPEQHPKRNVYLIIVQGEEDLGIIPAIIEAPSPVSSRTGRKGADDEGREGIRTLIIYGIPDKGIDIFEPDHEIKQTARDIVKHMEVEHGTGDSI